jgi:hypothetical protein
MEIEKPVTDISATAKASTAPAGKVQNVNELEELRGE